MMNPPLTLQQMVECYAIFDQTVGCRLCSKAWWAENATDVLTHFHERSCPLWGRDDVYDMWSKMPTEWHGEQDVLEREGRHWISKLKQHP